MKKNCSNWTIILIMFFSVQFVLWLHTSITHKSIDISYKANKYIVYYEQEPTLFLAITIVSIIGLLYFVNLIIEVILCKDITKHRS